MTTYHPISRNPRYTITHEATRRFVLRLDGATISIHTTYPSAVIRAVGHANPNPPIVAIDSL